MKSEVEKATEDLVIANEKLKKLDMIKTEFISIASHQLRTPLSGVKGYLSMLLEGDFGELDEKKREIEVEPFYKAVQTLALCNLPKVIITSSYSEAVYIILRKCEEFHDDFIQGVYGREQHKTKTEKIWHALKLFRVKMTEVLYIGDLVSDILYCRDVPIDIACVGYGYHPVSYLKKFSPNCILETMEDFVVFLQNLSPKL